LTFKEKTPYHKSKDAMTDGKQDGLFDLKYMLKEAVALVHVINGLFDRDYQPDSTVSFAATESGGKKAEGLEKIMSDMVLTINRDAYLIEAQIGDDETIALRVFQYGFAYAQQGKQISPDGSLIMLTILAASILKRKVWC
jgi:hypothetical protein